MAQIVHRFTEQDILLQTNISISSTSSTSWKFYFREGITTLMPQGIYSLCARFDNGAFAFGEISFRHVNKGSHTHGTFHDVYWRRHMGIDKFDTDETDIYNGFAVVAITTQTSTIMKGLSLIKMC